jgi:hypothetical protein
MIQEVATISIEGKVERDLISSIAEIDVEEHIDSADVFRVRLSLSVQEDGTWTHLDDPRFTVWNRLQIVGGYPLDNAVLVDGHITHVRLSLSAPGSEESFLELTGMDASARMDLEEKQVAWPNKKDSDIAKQIFASHGLGWEVEDTQLQHAEAVATILQSETDIRFLRRLAARNGFECYVQGRKGFFRSPNLQDPPQKLLVLRYRTGGNLASLNVEVDGTPPTALEIRRIDPLAKQENQEKLARLPRRPLARRTLDELRANVPSGRRLLKQHPAAGTLEMQGDLRSGYDGAGQFVTVSGEIDSRAYGAVLHAKRLVTIRGAGSTHSGLYYVSRVRHHFTSEEYTQSFQAYRNGVGVTGTETFAEPPAILAIAPGRRPDGGSSGNRELPAQASPSTLGGGSR